MDIRLLGPLEVCVDDGTGNERFIPLGPPRRRALLGLLAMRAPAVVSRSALIDGVWGDEPPPAATKTLHAHVAHLRRTLAAAGADGLVGTKPPGYVLDAPPEYVDARRFEELVRRGRVDLKAGAVTEAAEALRVALRLWRGEVLDGCPLGEWPRAEAAALESTRLYAFEDLCAADLALGQHARVATELAAVIAREPLRERCYELLMVALYHGRRQADALAVYRKARTVLVAELGLEPGAGLRRLEAAILAGDDRAVTAIDTPAAPITIPSRQSTVDEELGAPVPAPLTALIGRDAEVSEVTGLLKERRLVTLTGVGGCGKTRLAVAVAVEYGPEARFVDLTGTSRPELVASAVASALGVAEHPDLPPLDALVRRLRPLKTLLVLDNCEHLADACAHLAESLLTACPGLRVLATSRAALGVPGEMSWPVPPLSIPLEGTADLAEVRRYAAVRLFLDRAAVPAVRALEDADAPVLAAICAGLDGLPLALELAAARTPVLTLAEIAERLHDPDLLRGADHGTRRHHSALHATMAWSYDLLSPDLRVRFRRLAVFTGGFTRDAAAAVWPDGAADPVDVLGDLVTKSLVVMQPRPTGARYRLLETIRHFGWDRLTESAAEEAETRARHAAFHLALAEDVGARLHGTGLEAGLDTLATEYDNLVAALSWFAERGPSADELQLASTLARYCHLSGRYQQGRRWLAGALSRAGGAPSAELARAVLRAAFLALFECDYADAVAHGERALAVHKELGDPAGTARSLSLLASVDRERGDYDSSLVRYAEALDIYRAAGNEPRVAETLQLAGFTAWLTGDLDRAERLIQDGLDRFQVLGDPEGVASARVHLAAVAHYRGESGRARWLAEDALARFRELDFGEGIAWALNVLGLVAHRDGESRRAVEALRASLDVHCGLGDRWRSAAVLEALAAVLAPDSATAAAELLGAAAGIRDAIGAPVPHQERPLYDATVAIVHSALIDRELYAARARGEALRLRDLPARLATLTG